jgi:putative nucleotidyltransferase with HDIG domain
VVRVLQEADSDAAAVQIESLLKTDQALAAKILRVVNSAYYGLSCHVSSLSQAVIILGLPQVRNLVLSVSALSMMKARTPRQRDIQRLFWRHALASSATAQIIAQQKRFSSSDEELVFIGGLLHDIGRLFLFTNFTDTYQEAVRYAEQAAVPVEVAEQRLLGMDHTEIGFELANMWHFPAPLAQVIKMHEGPFTGETPLPALAVHVADRLARESGHGETVPQTYDMDPVASRWLNLSDDDLLVLMADADERVRDVFQSLGFAQAA